MKTRLSIALLAALASVGSSIAQSVHNWTPPVPSSTEGFSSVPMAFVPILPCRVVDTRPQYGFPAPYGPPAILGNAPPRSFNIPAGPCPGIPSNAGAYSINVERVFGPGEEGQGGYLVVFPTGTPVPPTSDLIFIDGPSYLTNALIVAAGTGGSIDVFANGSTNLLMDINGYFLPIAGGTSATKNGSDGIREGVLIAGSDFAEALPARGAKNLFSPGDVLVISREQSGAVEKSSKPYDSAVIGVYSTRPAVLGADKGGEIRVDPDDVPVAITGIVPTKVVSEGGPIEPGDLLTTSSTPGHAMKATRGGHAGTVIGKALESFRGTRGVIRVLILMR